MANGLAALLIQQPRLRGPVSPALTPFALDFTAEGGTNGNPVTTSDTGNNGVFDAITIGTGATFAYDNSTAGQGSQSIQVATSATAANCFGRWSSSVASQFIPTQQLWTSTMFKFTAAPSVSLPVLFARTGIDAGAIAIRVHTDGHLRIYDTNSLVVNSSAVAIPFNAFFRVEVFFYGSPTMGQCEVRTFYSPWATGTPDDVFQGGGIAANDYIFTGFRAGICGGNVSSVGPFWMDRPRINNVAYPTPDPHQVSITLTDPGTGSDSLVDAATVTLSDPGAGTDAIVTGASLSLSDSAVGSDAMSDGATVSLPDTGTSVDAIVAAITATLADSGVGTDTLVSAQSKTLADSGTGIDALVVAVTAALSDIGEGVDAVVQYFHFGDTGQGSDTLAVTVSLSPTDSGAGSDQIQASQVFVVNLSDAGVGTDSIVVVSDNTQSIALSDSGSGSDAIVVAPGISLVDSGSGSDTIHVTVQMWLGYDDPVPEGHAAFDPHEAAEQERSSAAFTPIVRGGRESITVVRPSWQMTAKAFVAHMNHMHGGKNPSEHRSDHQNGSGGVIRHVHG